ncbi:hypothetical protein ACP3XC_02540 [Vibrio anguillarum]
MDKLGLILKSRKVIRALVALLGTDAVIRLPDIAGVSVAGVTGGV